MEKSENGSYPSAKIDLVSEGLLGAPKVAGTPSKNGVRREARRRNKSTKNRGSL